MKLQDLELSNFMSWEKVKISLSDQGLVLVKGENKDSLTANSNGSGKSSLLSDSWLWVLYGRSSRGVSGSNVVRHDTTEGCFGVLTLTDSSEDAYRITRFQDHPERKNSLILEWKINPKNVTIETGAFEEVEFCKWADISKPDKRETQKAIEDLIGFPMQVALNAIVLGQSSIAFASMTDSEKKITLEKILEFDKLTAASKKAREKVKELEIQLSGKEVLIESYNQQIESLRTKRVELVCKSSEWEEEQEVEKEKLKTRLMVVIRNLEQVENGRGIIQSDLDKLRESFKVAEEEYQVAYAEQLQADATLKAFTEATPNNEFVLDSELKQKEQEYEQCIQQTEMLIDAARKRKGEVEAEEITTTCPTCKQSLPADAVAIVEQKHEDQLKQANEALIQNLSYSFAERSKAKREIEVAKQKCKEYEEGKEKFQEDYSKLETVSDFAKKKVIEVTVKRDDFRINITKEQEKLGHNRNLLSDYKQEESSIKASLNAERENPYSAAIKQTTDTMEELEASSGLAHKEIGNIRNEFSLYDFWVRGFGKSGIQSYMLDSLIPQLNQNTAKYINVLFGGEVEVEFRTQRLLADGKTLKEDFHIAVENKYGSDVYSGNSAGEQERIDICVALGLQDLVASRRGGDFKFCILDEVAKHLDAEGVELYYELLQEVAKEKDSVFIITHSPYLEGMFDKVWAIEKEGKISRLVA